MHTEHLQNVHPVRILGGWMVALAVTGIAAFGFIALGLLGRETEGDVVWAMASVGVGFLVGGWFTGVRTLEAPILHGVALGLTTLLVWAVLNVVVVLGFGTGEWTGLGETATLVVLLVQVVAAVVGCWVGTRGARLRSAHVTETPAAGVRERGRD
jgi:hypothetical protein